MLTHGFAIRSGLQCYHSPAKCRKGRTVIVVKSKRILLAKVFTARFLDRLLRWHYSINDKLAICVSYNFLSKV
jgi:hypothetical protein